MKRFTLTSMCFLSVLALAARSGASIDVGARRVATTDVAVAGDELGGSQAAVTIAGAVEPEFLWAILPAEIELWTFDLLHSRDATKAGGDTCRDSVSDSPFGDSAVADGLADTGRPPISSLFSQHVLLRI